MVVSAYPMERVTRAGEVILEAPHYQATYTLGGVKRHRELRAELSTLQTLEQPEWLEPFIQLVSNFRIYKTWNLSAIAKPTLDYKDAQAPYLHREGRNLAHVLRHWRNAPRQHRDQFAWVLHHTREAFPGLIEDIEFTPEGQLVFYPPGAHADDHLPMHLAADGLLTGLLQLTALAGTPDGGVVAFDEIENQLHPHAIRCILRAARQIAEERDLTILMTTHSPVVMNAFRHEPEQFFVIDPAHGASPVALTELHDEDWLAQFSLGDLYDRLVFGAPEPLAEQE